MNKLIKPAILSISSLIIIAGSAVSPALAEIKKTFPLTDISLIKMVVTLPSIVLIPFSLFSGRISASIRKRKILIISLIIYIIGGVSGGLSRNIYELLFFRIVLGLAMGFLLPLSTSLIADFYEGSERTQMMGLSNAVANLGAIIASLTAGWLAVISWRYVFSVYLIALVVLILIALGLPEPPKRTINKDSNYNINFKVIKLSLFGLLLNVAFYSVAINIAIFIEERNLGNSQAAGMAMSSLTLAGLLSGIFLQQLSKLLSKTRVPLSITLMSIGFLLLSLGWNLLTVLASTFLIGFGFGILKPILLLRVTEITPRFSNTFAISLVNSSMFLGKFISPFVLDFLGNIFRNNTTSFIFTLVGISLLGASILSLQDVLYKNSISQG